MWPFHKSAPTADALRHLIETLCPDSAVHVSEAEKGTWRIVIEGDGDEDAVRAALKREGVTPDKMRIVLSRARAPVPAPAKKPTRIDVSGVRHIIAVASGKGGVGKSTVAAMLAGALAQRGVRTGLLDADIYGPSIPIMMGVSGQKPVQNDVGKIVPILAHGIHVISIGFMVDQSQALIWRGPMVQSAFKQLLTDVAWPDLDVLILDTPPGTGDVQLTLAQSIDVAGAVIVSTPQELALSDARKGVAMFEKLNVPIIGLIENMSGPVFGEGGARVAAAELKVPFLGSIPLDATICAACDAGHPPVHDAIKKVADHALHAIGWPYEPSLHSAVVNR